MLFRRSNHLAFQRWRLFPQSANGFTSPTTFWARAFAHGTVHNLNGDANFPTPHGLLPALAPPQDLPGFSLALSPTSPTAVWKMTLPSPKPTPRRAGNVKASSAWLCPACSLLFKVLWTLETTLPATPARFTELPGFPAATWKTLFRFTPAPTFRRHFRFPMPFAQRGRQRHGVFVQQLGGRKFFGLKPPRLAHGVAVSAARGVRPYRCLAQPQPPTTFASKRLRLGRPLCQTQPTIAQAPKRLRAHLPRPRQPTARNATPPSEACLQLSPNCRPSQASFACPMAAKLPAHTVSESPAPLPSAPSSGFSPPPQRRRSPSPLQAASASTP